MKTCLILSFAACATSLTLSTRAATIMQTFETGEDTSAWGSTWSGGSVVPTFLSSSFGGELAGGGTSSTQGFSRAFRGNTAGLDVASAYMITAYVQVNTFDGAAGGLFEIIDGSYGSANAANLGIRTETISPGVFAYHWQAKDGGVWRDLGIALDLGAAYQFALSVDPLSFLYSAEVTRVNPDGSAISSGGLAGLAFDPNVITNQQNGELRFYIQASGGGTDAIVDNINIQSVPEPSPMALVAGAALLGWHRKRTASAA